VRPAAAARHVWTASLAAATSLFGARTSAAQTTGTVDLGVSTVRYDGFLPSAAASLTPTLTWGRPGAAVTARGTYLRFESGRRSLQGLVAASVFTPPSWLPHRWRGEFSLSTGGSSYADFASFWHATGEARLHFVAGGRGAWIGVTGGRTSYGSAPRPVAVAGVGVWARRAQLTVAASATRSMVGDTAYSDLVSTIRASRGRFELDASLAARVSSRGGGHGVHGEASTTLTLGERIALFVSGGRYPTDPVSGSVAGRYGSVGVRLRTALARPRVFRDRQPLIRSPANGDGGAGSSARLQVQPAPDGTVRVVVHAAAATTVEVAGDFTDWQAVTLRRTGEDMWETVLHVPSGVHRVNVRIDGGMWIAPAGTARAEDEFGGDVGIVAVP
jgi:Glycogen recognition site of AMP-activated protein kinase